MPLALGLPVVAALPHSKLSHSETGLAAACAKVRFALDSPLEGTGFELLVPLPRNSDLPLHHVRDHRHDLRHHLLASDFATRKAEGCLLEARRYG